MMRKQSVIILVVILLWSLSLPVLAAGSNVVDGADLLTDSEEIRLQEAIDEFVSAYQMDLVILTCDSLEGKTATAYADDYYDYHQYGVGGDHSGILLLICMDTREWAVSTTGTAMNLVSDYDVDRVMSRILDYLSSGDYDYAFHCFIAETEDVLKSSEENIPRTLLIAVAIGCAVGLVSILIMRSGMNTARAQSGAASYTGNGLKLTVQRDIFLYSHTSRTVISQNKSGSHVGSSGRSHGGSSGRF